MIMDALMLLDGSVNATTGVVTPTAVNSGTTFVDKSRTDSANVIDVSQLASSASGLGRDIGIGDDPLWIVSQINTAFAGAGSSMAAGLMTAPDNGSGAVPSAQVTTTVTAADATKTLACANTAGFVAGAGIELEGGTVRQEYAIITAVVPNMSIAIQFPAGGALFTHTANYNVQAWTLLAQGSLVPVGLLTAGTEIFRTPVPIGVQKFIKLSYLVMGANMTAGKIISSIVLDRTALGPALGYPSGYSNQYL